MKLTLGIGQPQVTIPDTSGVTTVLPAIWTDGTGSMLLKPDGSSTAVGGSAVSVVNDLTTGGTTSALSAQQGVVLNAAISANTTAISGKIWYGTGVPSASLGADGDGYIRLDKPYLGVVYTRASGAWSIADNSYTIATLPAPSAALDGLVITVTDASTDGTHTYPADFRCKSFDGGATYFWVPLGGRWRLYEENPDDNTTTGQVTGTGADLTVKTVNLPNTPYVWVPNMTIRLEAALRNTATTLAASDTTTRTAHSYIKNGSTLLFDQTLTQSNSGTVVKLIDGDDTRSIRVLSNVANQRLLSTSAAGGFGSATTATPLSLTLQNLALSFIVNGPTTDSYKYFHRAIELVYPG